MAESTLQLAEFHPKSAEYQHGHTIEASNGGIFPKFGGINITHGGIYLKIGGIIGLHLPNPIRKNNHLNKRG
ncbi:hypothetical protein V7659_06310 [Neobacillus drentensis]|uniref:hypothetical protein n=1 Tax=Neobacillus drentensis TaxID=220684 RepID=UPI002FFF7749